MISEYEYDATQHTRTQFRINFSILSRIFNSQQNYQNRSFALDEWMNEKYIIDGWPFQTVCKFECSTRKRSDPWYDIILNK